MILLNINIVDRIKDLSGYIRVAHNKRIKMNQDQITEAIVKGLIKQLISEAKGIVKGISDETKQFFEIGLSDYLNRQLEKYSVIKTLLKGNTPVNLYDIYYPLKLIERKRRYDEGKIVSTDSFVKFIKRKNYITIIGDAGSGKSTLMRHLYISSINEKAGIPILIELRQLNNSDSGIEDYIIKTIFENQISENASILERLLKNGKFVFFLDGYDELNALKKDDVINNLNKFIEKYQGNKYILTTRPYSNIENLPLFKNYEMKPLSFEKGEISGFIRKQLGDEPELAEKIISSISENKNKYIDSFLVNPLLLSLYILTYQSNSSIPDKKYIFYRRVINALFSEHDSKTKLGYQREKLSKLRQEEFEEVLKAFCFLSYFENTFNFDYDYIDTKLGIVRTKMPHLNFENSTFIKDMKSAVALWTEDQGVYGFAHRSLQEYFAALFLKHLNPEDKERAYNKIIDKFGKNTRLNEVENFLSLCEEMDIKYFYKYYAIPLYEEMLKYLDFKNEETTVHSLVKFMTGDKIYLDRHQIAEIEIANPILYKTLYLSLPYMQSLHRLLVDHLIGNRRKKNKNQKQVEVLDISKKLPAQVLEDIPKTQLIELAKSFKSHLEESLLNAKSFLEKAKETDSTLVDLI